MPTKRIQQEYFDRDTAEVAKFVDSLKSNATKEGGVFDSAAATDFITTATNQTTGVTIPPKLQAVFDECRDEASRSCVTKAILDGISVYEEQHGTNVPADVVEQAIHMAYATTSAALHKSVLDAVSANSDHQDNGSIQPNRAVVSILACFIEAVPFAHYLPADIQSNEAKLAIVSHQAGTTYGFYNENDLLDGTHSGGAYISTSRLHTSNPDADGKVRGKLTVTQVAPTTDGTTWASDFCDQNAAGVTLLRGRAIVYVNGVIAAQEPINSPGTGNSPINGSITVAGTNYVIGGVINTDTGVYALTSTPALPATMAVSVESFIDLERNPDLTPRIITSVSTFPLYANSWRVLTRQSIDGRTQMANELNLDPYSESVLAIQNQFANERHYNALAKMRRLAANNASTYNFDWQNRSQQLKRNDIWHDFAATLAAASQQMAIDTMNHGITHLYVGKDIASQWMTLATDIFEPSGIATRPGIFRVGRLFGQYDVYYTPREAGELPTSGKILCIGRATDVARNPIVLGDAVPPTVIPLAVNGDLRQGAGFYARNFTCVNPHEPSSRGCAVIDVTNLR